jgi:hypothetical protein
MRFRISLLVTFLLLSAACAPLTKAQSPIPNQAAPAAVTPVLSATAILLPTATETPSLPPTPSETTTLPAAAIPPFLTSTPGIAATLTAAFSTPGAQETLIANQTMVAATVGPKVQVLSSSMLSQCPNPSDAMLQNVAGIPVMPQATAGQVVRTLIGDYYCFRAPVTVKDMENFYKQKLPPPNWILQSDLNGQMIFIGFGSAGLQQLFLFSGPGNKNDLIVAISVSNPISMPTPTK